MGLGSAVRMRLWDRQELTEKEMGSKGRGMTNGWVVRLWEEGMGGKVREGGEGVRQGDMLKGNGRVDVEERGQQKGQTKLERNYEGETERKTRWG